MSREGANRQRAGALRADWTKRGTVWILPFVAKLHNGKSIGAGRAAAGRGGAAGSPGHPPPGPGGPRRLPARLPPLPPPPESAFPGEWCGGAWRGAASREGEGRARPRGRPGGRRGPPTACASPGSRSAQAGGELRASGEVRGSPVWRWLACGPRVCVPPHAPRGRVKPLAGKGFWQRQAFIALFYRCSSRGTLVTGLDVGLDSPTGP